MAEVVGSSEELFGIVGGGQGDLAAEARKSLVRFNQAESRGSDRLFGIVVGGRDDLTAVERKDGTVFSVRWKCAA